MIFLKPEHQQAIERHGEVDYPYECCGLLLGVFGAEGKVVKETYPISNAREEAAKRTRFLITPQELLKGELYARGKSLDVVGFYHSHPDHPARPSQYDLDHAWPTYSYIVLAVAQGKAQEATSWEMSHDRTQFNLEKVSKGD